jgi:peroxiredoxin
MPALPNTPAPDFTLNDLEGTPHTLSGQRGRLVVVNFWSAECPWSRRADEIIAGRLAAWSALGVIIWGIASNFTEPEYEIRAEMADRGTAYPVLLDPGHAVADLYEAVATPHFFLVDAEGLVRYAGALDDANYRARQAKVFYLEEAIVAVAAGRAPQPAQTPAYGCAIVRLAPG